MKIVLQFLGYATFMLWKGAIRMFFENEKCDWTSFTEDERVLAEDAFDLLEDEIYSNKRPKAFFLSGFVISNFIGYENASDELKKAIADEIVYQWDLGHAEQAK